MWIQRFVSSPPASMSATRVAGSSLSRAATAQPAEPAPITMKSASIVGCSMAMSFPPTARAYHNRRRWHGERRVSMKATHPGTRRRPHPGFAGNWLAALAVYRQPRLIAVLLMGFSSGLPLVLTFGTLSYWLAEIGVSLTTIGLFGLVRTSYSLKFLWSPLIDRLPIPLLTARLGRRRSWALAIELLLAAAILALGMTDPRVDPALTALAAVIVAFLSASQDIVIDAYRIELLRPDEQGAGAAATQWGYRFGMLASGAGALYAASFGGWRFAYAVMAALMGVGMLTVWLTPEPDCAPPPEALPGPTAVERAREWLKHAVVAPFLDLVARNGAAQLIAIGVFIVLYKFGDAALPPCREAPRQSGAATRQRCRHGVLPPCGGSTPTERGAFKPLAAGMRSVL